MSVSPTGNGRIPRFRRDSVNPDLAPNWGEAFQSFAFELLRKTRPALRSYPAAGKDGGIDLVQDLSDGRSVFECKYIDADGIDTARARWRACAKNLTRNLPAQSSQQYSPWWDVEKPIRGYTFCVSSTLANEAQVDALKKEIREVLRSLGEDHAHLRHLCDVSIDVRHWPNLAAELGDAPDLLFKWFPKTRPLGLVPIESSPPRGLFSSFLDRAKLGYYSRDQHIAAHGIPQGIEIETEMAMLSRLSQTAGLIVTGAGGHGKTRLVHELGLLARSEGWCVLRVSGPWRPESLERLGESIPQSTGVLLLVDYVETQQGFVEAVNDLVDMDDVFGMQVKYIANCRTSFYPKVAHLPQHNEVPLSPVRGVEWFREFRHAIVRHILTSSEVGVDSRTLQVCHDVPVVAVFLAYLSATGRTDDLQDLLKERDFARWVHRRVERSFPQATTHDVAAMVAQFPMSEAVALELAPVGILSTLERDGWIEQQSTTEGDKQALEWAVVHDVLADQLLTSSLAEQGAFAAATVKDLLATAVANGTLASMLSSLQRIRDQVGVETVPISAVVRDQFALGPQEWVAQAPNLLGASPLEPEDVVAVLESGRDIWSAKLARSTFRQQVGWLARQISLNTTDPEIRNAILGWLHRALEIEETDYLLRSSLFLSPSATAPRAEAWIAARPTDFATHFVITAWLIVHLPPADIGESVVAWLDVHADHPRARHVLVTWLASGGEPTLVEPFLLRWLRSHYALAHDGSRVLSHWMTAEGSLSAVEHYVVQWMKLNSDSPHSSHVLNSWIERGADLDTIQPLVEQWLGRHGQMAYAGYVITAWLDQGGSLDLVREEVEAWLDRHAGGPEGPKTMAALVRASPKTSAFIRSLSERWGMDATALGFGSVLTGWLAGGGSPALVQPQLDEWLAKFHKTPEAGGVYLDWLSQGDPPAEAIKGAIGWFLLFPTNSLGGQISKSFVLGDSIDPDTVRAILGWCTSFPTHEDALWRLTQLKTNLWMEEVSEEVLRAAEVVSAAALTEPDLSTLQATQLTTLCTYLASRFQTGVAADRCDAVLVAWLRHPKSFQHGDVQLIHAERPVFIGRMLSLLLRGWIGVDADAPALARMLAWVASWETESRAEARLVVDRFATVYPEANSLWEIVPS